MTNLQKVLNNYSLSLQNLALKEKLKILEGMSTHSQYCASGDQTVEALKKSVFFPFN